jgi:hypothetical protein
MSSPRHSRFSVRLLEGLVGGHDRLDDAVADDVALVEPDELDAVDAVQDAVRFLEARDLSLREVDLRDVARDDGLAPEAHARQEHLHLLGRRVLRLVEDHERVVQRAAAHERERRDLDDVPRSSMRPTFS